MRDALTDLSVLADRLVEEVRDHGSGESSVRNYGVVSRLLIGHARAEGFGEWTDDLRDRLLEWIEGRRASGEIHADYARFERRVTRMLSSLAETGEVDFSRPRGIADPYPVDAEAMGVVEAVLDDGRVPPSVRGNVGGAVRHLLWYAAERGRRPLEIDDALVMEFLVGEMPSTNASSTDNVLHAVRLATSWLRDHGGRVVRDYTQLKVRCRGSRIIPAFTEAEIRAVVAAIDASTEAGMRNRAIVLTAYCTGLRLGDVLSLRRDEIDWRKATLTTSQSKTHTPITCALNGETMNAIADYILKARPDCDLPEVFLTVVAPHRPLSTSGVKAWFESACRRAGVEKVPGRAFHSIRRAFETVAVSRGVPIETASQLLGHATIEEDKPYITYDRERVSSVSMDFGDVPILHGTYADRRTDGGE